MIIVSKNLGSCVQYKAKFTVNAGQNYQRKQTKKSEQRYGCKEEAEVIRDTGTGN